MKSSTITKNQKQSEEENKFKEYPIVSIASYNVLFPPRSTLFRKIINPVTRYEAQFNEVFPHLNADIYCLQETHEMYIETFEKSKMSKEGYQYTPLDPNRTEVHSPMIMSRLPFTLLYSPKYENKHSKNLSDKNSPEKNKIKRFVICLFTIEDINLIVISAHLTSYETNRKGRQEEMRLLDRVLKTLVDKQKDNEIKSKIKDAFNNKNVILCGDLNLHYPGENKIFEHMLFHDLWLERHSHFDGLTWDPYTCKMFWKINPFDTRRLRLDRICMYQSKQIDLIDIDIFGNSCVGVGTDSENKYLFPSDHFGIVATFKSSPTGFTQNITTHKKSFNMLPKDETGCRRLNTINAYILITLLILALIGK